MSIISVAMKVIAGVVGFFVVLILIIYFGAQISTTTEPKKEAPAPVYNPVTKWGAEKVASANKVMTLIN